MQARTWGAAVVALLVGVGSAQAQPRPLIGNGVKHARARIDAIDVRGNRARVLVTLQVDPGWHISWRNPGETGLPTRLSWNLPAGVHAIEETWPVPVITHTPVGDTHTLEGDVPWLIEFRVDSASSVDRLIGLTAKYGVCRDVCIPEQLTAQGVLPAARGGARRQGVAPAVQGRLAVAAGTIAARRLSPTLLCFERIPLRSGASLPEVVADSGLGLDKSLRLTAGRGRSATHALAMIPATAELPQNTRVLFVSGASGAAAVLDFERPAPRCSAR